MYSDVPQPTTAMRSPGCGQRGREPIERVDRVAPAVRLAGQFPFDMRTALIRHHCSPFLGVSNDPLDVRICSIYRPILQVIATVRGELCYVPERCHARLAGPSSSTSSRPSGRVDIDDAAARLDVSAATIRRDLDELASQQLLVRTRGGAVPHSVSYDLPLRYKMSRHADEKHLIGLAAADLVVPGGVVGLNGGTTTTEVARALVLRTDLGTGTNDGSPTSPSSPTRSTSPTSSPSARTSSSSSPAAWSGRSPTSWLVRWPTRPSSA